MDIDIEKEAREVEKELQEEGYERNDYKWLKFTVGVLMLVLFLSYFMFDPYVRDVITGFFESDTIREDFFQYQDKRIVFTGDTYDELIRIYEDNQEHEFKACILGKIVDDDYIVQEIHSPETHFQSVYRVVSEHCPENTIIDLHSHPYQRCVASQQDLRSLNNSKKVNPQILMAVMCTEERMSFYG